jgi:type VI secretion system secreted protein Hcp
MPIYMKITKNGLPVINGDVTAKGHEKWIELTSAQLGTFRTASTPGGTEGQKEVPAPAVKEIVITKIPDSASRLLILAAMTPAKDDLKVQIDFVKPDNKGDSIYLTFTLQDVIITGFQSASGGRLPSERLTLNFTKITFDSHQTGADISPSMGWRPLQP